MKKIIVLAATLLLALGSVQAQDTLTMGPKADYRCPAWFDTTRVMLWDLALNSNSMAIGGHPHGKLRIYGIAASVMMPGEFFNMLPQVTHFDRPVIDSSLNNVGGFLRLYDYSDSLGTLTQRGEDLWVGKATTPVNYYLRPNFDSLYANITFNPSAPPDDFAFPVYERYFSTPQDVTDSFFVGLTDTQYLYEARHYYDDDRPLNDHFSVSVPRFLELGQRTYNKPVVASQDSSENWNFTSDHIYILYYIFPILTPGVNLPDNPIDTTIIDTTIIDTTIIDTTIIDTTSVGIGDVQLVGRYVSLLPNPATDQVKVLSSFGLRRVEIYNAAGARVRQEELRGYTATLRVDDLPEGAYLIRIHTPAGNTTKKLIVRR